MLSAWKRQTLLWSRHLHSWRWCSFFCSLFVFVLFSRLAAVACFSIQSGWTNCRPEWREREWERGLRAIYWVTKQFANSKCNANPLSLSFWDHFAAKWEQTIFFTWLSLPPIICIDFQQLCTLLCFLFFLHWLAALLHFFFFFIFDALVS